MEHFGEELKRERESRGIGLQEITAATKISSRHLVALEDEKFRQLPGGVFNKGIVRGYARVVGLDEDTWVNRYLTAYQQSGAICDDDISWFAFAENVSKARPGKRDRSAERLRWAGVFVLLTVLAVAAYFVYGYVHQRLTALPVHAAEQSTLVLGDGHLSRIATFPGCRA
ncbi:MAG TPA: helix-turn-helix domain-containing protein [Acidisarcina sp.]|nr:helix-turn-helix domain-containing protein [Acidisarcina sp.]